MGNNRASSLYAFIASSMPRRAEFDVLCPIGSRVRSAYIHFVRDIQLRLTEFDGSIILMFATTRVLVRFFAGMVRGSEPVESRFMPYFSTTEHFVSSRRPLSVPEQAFHVA